MTKGRKLTAFGVSLLLLAGMAFAQGQFDATTCIVKDISDTGARIALDDENCFVPKRLKLYIAERHFLADCGQVWRKGCEVGLNFISGISMK